MKKNLFIGLVVILVISLLIPASFAPAALLQAQEGDKVIDTPPEERPPDEGAKGEKDVPLFGIVSVTYARPYTIRVTVKGHFCHDCNPNPLSKPGDNPFKVNYPPPSYPWYEDMDGPDGRYVAVRITGSDGLMYGMIKMICNPTNWPLCRTVYKTFIFDLRPPRVPWFNFPVKAEADFYCSECGHWYATPRNTGAFYAVVVGINDYIHIGDLNYCVNDAREFRAELLRHANTPWRTANIRLLLNRAATKGAIRAAIAAMVARGTEQDVLVFFFSGHGSHGADVPPFDEEDEKDEYLCPADTRPGPGVYGTMIRDDELKEWLKPFKGRVKVILDSCYSGGFKTVKDATTKTMPGVPPVKLVDAFDKDLHTLPRGSVITACREDEVAWEFHALANGLFSYYVIEGLCCPADAAGDRNDLTTLKELFEYAEPRVLNYPPGPDEPWQHPQGYFDLPVEDCVIIGKPHRLVE